MPEPTQNPPTLVPKKKEDNSGPEPLKTKAGFTSQVTVSAIRAKSTKIEGGDFDDKRDRITFTLKFRNADPNRPFPGLNLKFYLFGQSLVDQKAFQLLQLFEKSFRLEPLQEMEFVTQEVATEWDNTGAIFGAKYKGWYLFVTDQDGEVLAEKNSVPFIDNPAELPKTTVGSFYNRKLEPVKVN